MKTIAIIGGGFAGCSSARKLETQFDVILIDTKDYFEFTPSVLRTLVEPQHLSKIQVKHADYLRHARIMIGEAQRMEPHLVHVGDKKIAFDYGVICSGSGYNTPIKAHNLVMAARGKELQLHAKALHDAEHALIIGGGLVGVELAAEISTAFSQKKVTLVHAGTSLLERSNTRAQTYAQQYLLSKRVQLRLNERVLEHKNHAYHTDKATVTADIAFWCTGIRPNSACAGDLGCINEKSQIRVRPTLQLEKFSHIFAAGDVNCVAEEKTAQNAEEQAKIVVRNIIHIERGEALEEYSPTSRVMVTSLGKYDGMMTYKQYMLRGIVPAMLKAAIEWKTMIHLRRIMAMPAKKP